MDLFSSFPLKYLAQTHQIRCVGKATIHTCISMGFRTALNTNTICTLCQSAAALQIAQSAPIKALVLSLRPRATAADFFSSCCTFGMRVEPPTSTTSSTLLVGIPESAITSGAVILATRG